MCDEDLVSISYSVIVLQHGYIQLITLILYHTPYGKIWWYLCTLTIYRRNKVRCQNSRSL